MLQPKWPNPNWPEMPRESTQARQARVQKILEGLEKTYPNAHCELNYSNPLELLIATILSAQCTDKQVNIVTAELFKKYRSARDYAAAPAPALENDIKRIGLFRNKAKNIQACCRTLLEKHGGKVPATMDELVQLGGVGRKTANVVLGNAFNINEGVVVDTHVTRLSHRLGLTEHEDAVKIERDLMAQLPQEEWIVFSHRMIWHGRRICKARRPLCGSCVLDKICPKIGVQ